MTIKKQTRCGGLAAVISRQRLQNISQQIDPHTISKITTHNYNTIVGFNEKDQLQLANKEENRTNDDDKTRLIKEYNDTKHSKVETIKIDDIVNCVNAETYPNCSNTLVFYVSRNTGQEAIALRFENEQDFKRIYFTYKYFKMRNRLTKNHTNYTSSENLYSKKKTYNDTLKIRKNSVDNYEKMGKTEFDLHQTTDNNGVMHLSVQQKSLSSRFDQPMSLIGIRTPDVLGEIDSVIYKDVDIPVKPDRKRLFQKLKSKAPPPPANKDNQNILKGQFVRVNVERVPDVVPKEIKVSKIPDILAMRDKQKNRVTNNNIWTTSNKGVTGYESDREEWRSRSQFSTSAFDSLARPTKLAMALTLRKPASRSEAQLPQYYRLADAKGNVYTRPPNNFVQRPARLPRPPDIKRNQLNGDHKKFTSLQNLDSKAINEKRPNEKRVPYANISTRLSGLTSRLKDLGGGSNVGRLKAQTDVVNLKPVIKKSAGDGAKRPVVRTCSAEPPKKVTFSAFATVQVV